MSKRSIIKRILAASVCAAVALSLTACGQSGSGSEPESAGGAPESSAATPSRAESSASATAESSAAASAPETSFPEDTPYTLGGELTPAMIARSRYNEGNKVRLARVIKKMQAGEDVTVAYIGGSITQGTSAGNDLCYAKLTTDRLQEMFPDSRITYVNAGIGATGSYIGVHRADADVLSHSPDLVFVEFSVNDTTERTEINKEAYASLLRKLWESASAPALVTIAMTQENGTSFQEKHGEIIKAFDIPMISYKNVILDIIDKGYITWKDISDDNIHPNVPGHALLSKLVVNYIQSVIDEVDSISGGESDFSSAAELGVKYKAAKMLMSDNTEPKQLGAFKAADTMFGGFKSPWLVKRTNGTFTEDDALVIEFTGKNVGLLYGKLTKNGVKADIYIDDELVKTIDSDFPNGWGNYVEFEEIKTGLSEGSHTMKVAPKSAEGAACFYVSGLTVS